MSIVDKVVKAIRSDLSEITTDHDKNDSDLYQFVGVNSSRSYSFIQDALYLLEDTQLAKAAFQKAEFQNQDFGTLYLFYYGLLNACYMQQRATIILCDELGIEKGLESIKKAEIINYRNSFAAHSAERGWGNEKHSFILNRHAMCNGRVEGYSSNHTDGYLPLKANISELLKDWNSNLDEVFLLIEQQIYGDATS